MHLNALVQTVTRAWSFRRYAKAGLCATVFEDATGRSCADGLENITPVEGEMGSFAADGVTRRYLGTEILVELSQNPKARGRGSLPGYRRELAIRPSRTLTEFCRRMTSPLHLSGPDHPETTIQPLSRPPTSLGRATGRPLPALIRPAKGRVGKPVCARVSFASWLWAIFRPVSHCQALPITGNS